MNAGARGAAIVLAALILVPAAALAATSSSAPTAHSSAAQKRGSRPESCSQTSGGVGVGATCDKEKAHGYVNPFKRGSWSLSRIDMGVDYIPNRKSPVLAIGDAKILGSSMNSGWPGGAFMYYKLLNGDHKGDVI